jgi:Fic family protein
MITNPMKEKIKALKGEYDQFRAGKESLLSMIDEVEIPESVYNSNAIENSTLTLKETEKILLDLELSRNAPLREVYEAKNLARVQEYICHNFQNKEINQELILLLHQMLMGGINDRIAGRFRKYGEYVQVGSHIAPPPEQVENLVFDLLNDYSSDMSPYFLEKIAKFHLEFETIHPFNDGNGRMGRVLLNYQLNRFGFPLVIIRNKGKEIYYSAFQEYNKTKKTKIMEIVLLLVLFESLHKRITYLKGEKIISLSNYCKIYHKSASATFNAARRQTIPAFREKNVWMIGEAYP